MASLTEASLAQRREVSEAIKTKVDGALATLTEIWGEVGLSPQQQNKILVTLREEVFVQVDRLVREEEQIRSQYKEEIATSRAKISAICGELGIAVPEEAGSAESLTVSLTSVRNTLRDVTDKRAAVVVPFQERLEVIHGVCSRLGSEVGPAFLDVGTRLDDERLAELDERIRILSLEEKNRRAAIGKEADIIRDFIERLGAEWETELDRAIQDGTLQSMDPEQSLVDALSCRAQQLQQRMTERESEIKNVCRDIAVLWDTMGIENTEREDFLSKHHGVSDEVLASCKAERDRLGDLKKDMVGPLILRTRERICKLWDQLHTPPQERESFAAFKAEPEQFSEECLLLHEEAEARLRAEYKELSPILKEIAKRERVLAERAKFEKEQQDSSRLVARGRGAAARLKYEEKLRGRIKRLPELTKRLRASIVEWEKEKKPILVDGTPYLVLMQRQEEEYLADKKARREQRQRKRKGGGSSAGGSIGGSLSIARKRGKENAVRHR